MCACGIDMLMPSEYLFGYGFKITFLSTADRHITLIAVHKQIFILQSYPPPSCI